MTLEEAIEEQERGRNDALMLGLVKRADALQLGIEALKNEKRFREQVMPNFIKLLPGETE